MTNRTGARAVGLPDRTEEFLPEGPWVRGHDAGGVVVRHGLLSGRAFEWRFHLRASSERVVWCDARRFLRWRGRRDGSAMLATVPWTVSLGDAHTDDCARRTLADGTVQLMPPGWRSWVTLDLELDPVRD